MEAQAAARTNDAATAPVGSGVAIEGRDNPQVGLKVSPAAVVYAKKRLAERDTPNAAIRLGVRGGGCSGFSYVIEFSDDPPRERESVGSSEGVTFYVDKKSLVFLNGSTLDYTKTLMFQGFQFLNPQEASKCGCGHSFTVK
jgi:iron-sulfur cluster assembly protein